MKNNEMLYGAAGARRLDDIAPQLAEAYKVAFAGEPWYEVSRCTGETCSQGFCAESPGSACGRCGASLIEAYDGDALAASWREMIAREDALMEVRYKDDEPIRVTLARPTTPAELYARKYADVPVMEPWLAETMDRELVWIEDTFADRRKSPNGNLKERGRTLGAISLRYSSLPIATRTLSPAVIAATLRDVGRNATAYEGEVPIGVPLDNARRRGCVPDRRTLLEIKGVTA